MLTAGTTQHKLKDTGVQGGDGGRLLGNEIDYHLKQLIQIIFKIKNQQNNFYWRKLNKLL